MVWDFAAVLTALVLASGLIWGLDAWLLAPRRRAAAAARGQQADERVPMLVDYARSFFPIFLIVLLLRSFLVEPFRIPSGSMIPTLLVGDFILVNKYTYGIRLPVLNRKVIELGAPQRGDVVVFRYPLDPGTPFIKRVVGLPGDRIEYRDKRLFVNGEEAARVPTGAYVGTGASVQHTGAQVFDESIDGRTHEILITPGAPSLDGVFEVPEGHYFVLGDNRDNSRDSRFWGFVPEQNLVGRAFFIWFSWDGGPKPGRIGGSIE